MNCSDFGYGDLLDMFCYSGIPLVKHINPICGWNKDNVYFRRCDAIRKQLNKHDIHPKEVNRVFIGELLFYNVKFPEKHRFISQKDIRDALGIPYDFIGIVDNNPDQYLIDEYKLHEMYLTDDGELDFTNILEKIESIFELNNDCYDLHIENQLNSLLKNNGFSNIYTDVDSAFVRFKTSCNYFTNLDKLCEILNVPPKIGKRSSDYRDDEITLYVERDYFIK